MMHTLPFNKVTNIRMSIVTLAILIMSQFCFCQTDLYIPIEPQSTSTNTGSKPQSKVWQYKGDYYSVFPNAQGTHIWKLMEKQWVQQLLLTTNINSKADCYAVSDTVFVLLFQGQSSEFTALRFEESNQQYEISNPIMNIPKIVFDASTETATIAFDSKSELWMTYEANNNIEVRNLKAPYTSWSNPESIGVGTANDDISSIVKMSNSVGVLWSNQNTRQFGFKYHIDGDPISVWSSDEAPVSQSAFNIGDGVADDHINLKYTPDGELYAAVKTSYDTPSYTKIGLLVRRSNGIWENIHHVSYTGTRPIVAVDYSRKSVKVYYTSKEGGGDILLKESKLNPINFGKKILFLEGSSYSNVSSTKFPHDCNNLVIASDNSNVVGNMIECP